MDWIYYVGLRQSYLTLKLRLVKRRGYETYNGEEIKKDHEEEAKAVEENNKVVEKAPVLLLSRVNCILHSTIPMLRCTSTIRNFRVHMDSMRTSFTIAITSREPSLNTKKFCIARGRTLKVFLRRIRKHVCLTPFFTKRLKRLSKPDDFKLYGKMEVDFFSTSKMLHQKWKSRLRLIRAGPNFYMISDNPKVSLGIVECSLQTYLRCSQGRLSQENNGHACVYSRGKPLFGDFAKDIYHSCQTKPVHSRKHFQQCSSSSDCYCNEYEFCIHWSLY